jgi:hypothetical protein
MPFFSPFGYGYRFDAMANSLGSLLGVADQTRDESVDACIDDKLVDGEPRCFPDFIHGKDGTPGGTYPMGCSAAAAVIGKGCDREKSPRRPPCRFQIAGATEPPENAA